MFHAFRSFGFAARCALLVGLSLGCVGCGDDKAPKTGPDVADLDLESIPTGTVRGQILQPAHSFPDATATTIRLTDASEGSGFTTVNHSGRDGVKEILMEAVGPGPAILDYNNDGLMDVFVPEGDVLDSYDLVEVREGAGGAQSLRPLLRPKEVKPNPHYDQLWRNNGDGTFTNVAKEAGIEDHHWSFGATAFDFDGDGDTDVFVANFGPDRLWRNNGNGTFTDVAPEMGLVGSPRQWSTCAAVGDIDEDGKLDIYVAAYADTAFEMNRQRVRNKLDWGVSAASIPSRSCRWRGMGVYCGPTGLEGQQDRLYRQEDDGVFYDVTKRWRVETSVPQYGFTTAMFDFNGDGMMDLYVANDSVENFLWQQFRDADGNVFFRDTSDTVSVKYGHGLNAQASMGMTIGDIDRDGIFDILVTNFSYDYNNIYKGKRVNSTGSFFYRDRGLKVMGQPVYLDLSWGCGWVDFDNDADSDLFIANGHVYAEIDNFAKLKSKYKQLNALFECVKPEQMGYREIGEKAKQSPPRGVNAEDLEAGDGMKVQKCSRSATFADFDNDGKMDVLVGNLNDTPTLLMNTSKSDGNWVKIVLRQHDGNSEAIGATIEVETPDGIKQRFPVLKCASFLGTNDPRLHVGLGRNANCTVRVIWPGRDRATSTFEQVAANGLWVLDRDSGKAESAPMPAWKR